MNINDFIGQKVHFIGIGGISMSGLAEILLGRGYKVSGSDASPSHLTEKLEKMGAEIFIGQKYGNHKGAALVVKTSAISEDNEELRGAIEDGTPIIERIDVLNQIMGEYKTSVGISGMHGKTTCTSMTATILVGCNMNPTVHIGSELELIGGTTLVSDGDIFVAEACEYKDNFLSLDPNIEVVLNIDRDHLDYFQGIEHILDSFSKYIAKIPEDGTLIANGDDENVKVASKSAKCNIVTFGLGENNAYRAQNLACQKDGSCAFELVIDGSVIGPMSLGVPGEHNVYNALAAIAASCACGADPKCAMREVANYKGAKRRFEKVAALSGGAEVYHDYAHHPREVEATLKSAKDRGYNDIICIFQPHTYTRTKALFKEFTECFDTASHVIFVDIYAAREKNPGDIHSKDLCDAVTKRGKVKSAVYKATFEEAAAYAKEISAKESVILTLGAGSIEKINCMFG